LGWAERCGGRSDRDQRPGPRGHLAGGFLMHPSGVGRGPLDDRAALVVVGADGGQREGTPESLARARRGRRTQRRWGRSAASGRAEVNGTVPGGPGSGGGGPRASRARPRIYRGAEAAFPAAGVAADAARGGLDADGNEVARRRLRRLRAKLVAGVAGRSVLHHELALLHVSAPADLRPLRHGDRQGLILPLACRRCLLLGACGADVFSRVGHASRHARAEARPAGSDAPP